MNPTLGDVHRYTHAAPRRLLDELARVFPPEHFARLAHERFPFYRTTFWHPLERPASNVFEAIAESVAPLAAPSQRVTGVEWWFSVLDTNASPQWLLPCHFDRADLAEQDFAKIRHPERASVLFLNAVPYGELVVTDQVNTEAGARPRQPHDMVFIRPRRNLYAVFPGHLYHGVIGRLWRPERETVLRITMAINWWAEPPKADYLRDSRECFEAFGLAAPG